MGCETGGCGGERLGKSPTEDAWASARAHKRRSAQKRREKWLVSGVKDNGYLSDSQRMQHEDNLWLGDEQVCSSPAVVRNRQPSPSRDSWMRRTVSQSSSM